jgi:hypothetical protein
MHPKIDSVVTERPFYCGSCGQIKDAGPVVRRVNIRPDFPQEVEAVDTLECAACAVKAGKLFQAAMHDKLSDELHALSAERNRFRHRFDDHPTAFKG